MKKFFLLGLFILFLLGSAQVNAEKTASIEYNLKKIGRILTELRLHKEDNVLPLLDDESYIAFDSNGDAWVALEFGSPTFNSFVEYVEEHLRTKVVELRKKYFNGENDSVEWWVEELFLSDPDFVIDALKWRKVDPHWISELEEIRDKNIWIMTAWYIWAHHGVYKINRNLYEVNKLNRDLYGTTFWINSDKPLTYVRSNYKQAYLSREVERLRNLPFDAVKDSFILASEALTIPVRSFYAISMSDPRYGLEADLSGTMLYLGGIVGGVRKVVTSPFRMSVTQTADGALDIVISAVGFGVSAVQTVVNAPFRGLRWVGQSRGLRWVVQKLSRFFKSED